MKILVIQGSPDAASYSHELSLAYAEEARAAGNDVHMIDLAMEDESAPERYQELIAWADHLVFSFPIWWSAEPAILKGFIDRTFTPRFAYRFADGKSEAKLTGKTAALILTSRASALIYRLFGGPVTRWKHMILGFVGIRLTDTFILGKIDHPQDNPTYRAEFVEKVRRYARR